MNRPLTEIQTRLVEQAETLLKAIQDMAGSQVVDDLEDDYMSLIGAIMKQHERAKDTACRLAWFEFLIERGQANIICGPPEKPWAEDEGEPEDGYQYRISCRTCGHRYTYFVRELITTGTRTRKGTRCKNERCDELNDHGRAMVV